MKKFKLKGYKEDQYYWVYIYDSLKEMQKDASEAGGEEMGEALGVVQPYLRMKIHPDGSETALNNIGIIRLVKNKLHTHIIAHELVHAAMHHYRLTQTDRNANFGDGNSENEEDFGHIYAKYFSKMSGQLYKYGFWK